MTGFRDEGASALRGAQTSVLRNPTAIATLAAVAVALGFSTFATADDQAASPSAGPATWIGDLSPLAAEDWNYDRAAHLLERAGFGGTPQEIEALAAMTPAEAVRNLVYYQDVENVELPQFEHSGLFPSKWFIFKDSPELAKDIAERGESMGVSVKAPGEPLPTQPVVDAFFFYHYGGVAETRRAVPWVGERMMLTQRPLEEKLALFWHGHFATAIDKVRDYRKMLGQYETLRAGANGKFRDLLIAMAQDPAMLKYLDNRDNIKGHPNENFAREIFELFALGIGNYTEADIQEAARAFTGWTDNGLVFINRRDLHDEGEKTVLGRTGNFDGEDIVDIILEQDATSHFMARKLYRFFVRDEVNADLEHQLAASLRENNYEIAPFLEAIFLSRDFYSPASYATQFKSPVHLVVSTYRKLGLAEMPSVPGFHAITSGLGQEIFAPPNVKGWDGGRSWINPSTLFERQNFTRRALFPDHDLAGLTDRQAYAVEWMRGFMGEAMYGQFVEMAERGDWESPPTPPSDDPGAIQNLVEKATHNLMRGVFNGTMKLSDHYRRFEANRQRPAAGPVDFRLNEMLQTAGVETTSGAVDYLVARFIRPEVSDSKRQALVAFIETRRDGGTSLDYSDETLEDDLRELLHLILSMPEYQLA